MSLIPLDGPAKQGSISVTTSESEVKVGAGSMTERKVVTIQATNGKIYVSFESGVEGFLQFKNQIVSYEAGEYQSIYIKAVAGTVIVKIAERG